VVDDEVDRLVGRDALAKQCDEQQREEREETDGEPGIDASHAYDVTGST
jgi:hypothetical protein